MPVFGDVSTYPAIFILSQSAKKELGYVQVQTLAGISVNSLKQLPLSVRKHNDLGSSAWVIKTQISLQEILLEGSAGATISDLGHFYIGALTGSDQVFVVTGDTIEKYNLEEDLLFPYAYRGEEIERYGAVSPYARAIYLVLTRFFGGSVR